MYGRKVETEFGTYSIDKLTFEFWLRDFDQKQIEDILFLTGCRYRVDGFGGFKAWDKTYISGWKAKNFIFSPVGVEGSIVVQLIRRSCYHAFPQRLDKDGSPLPVVYNKEYLFGVRVQINPNKHLQDKFFSSLLVSLRDGVFKNYAWQIARVDYAFDVPLLFRDVCLLTQKTEGYYGDTTRYYGRRSHTGYTRLYDKALKENLPGPLIRFEWEQHREQSFKFDIPLTFGDIPERLQWLRFIRLEQLNDCLKSLDKRTRKKVRENCFQPIPFQPDIFNQLLAEYLFDFGFDERNHFHSEIEAIKRDELEQSLVEADNDLEKLFYYRAPVDEGAEESEVSPS